MDDRTGTTTLFNIKPSNEFMKLYLGKLHLLPLSLDLHN